MTGHESYLWWICSTRTSVILPGQIQLKHVFDLLMLHWGMTLLAGSASSRVHRNKEACSQSNPSVIWLHLVQVKHIPAWIIVFSCSSPTTIDASTPRMKPDRRSVVQQRCTFNKILIQFSESCSNFENLKAASSTWRSRGVGLKTLAITGPGQVSLLTSWLLSQSCKCALHAAN